MNIDKLRRMVLDWLRDHEAEMARDLSIFEAAECDTREALLIVLSKCAIEELEKIQGQ